MTKAYVKGRWRPVLSWREIRRGKNKGRYAVVTKDLVQENGRHIWKERESIVNLIKEG